MTELRVTGREDAYPLFFEVEKEYEEYLTPEVSDGPLVGCLLWAMERGMDIVCEGAVSDRLYHQLTEYMIPTISQNIKSYHAIQIHAPLSNLKWEGGAVGTGLSCGVDSFYTTMKKRSYEDGCRQKLTHLCFFNSGQMGIFGGERARNVFRERAKRFRGVAEEIGCGFFTCDTNLSEFLMQNYIKGTLFRLFANLLIVQKLFSLYYVSSSYPVNEFHFTDHDPAYYELFVNACLSTDSVRFEDVGGETTRMGKLEYLKQFDIVKRELNTCVSDVTNCTRCNKCRRTMLNLYALGILDEFSAVYDVEWFKKNKGKMRRWAVLNFWRTDQKELNRALRKAGKLHFRDYIGAVFALPFWFFPLAKRKIALLRKIKKSK